MIVSYCIAVCKVTVPNACRFQYQPSVTPVSSPPSHSAHLLSSLSLFDRQDMDCLYDQKHLVAVLQIQILE
jgi:hypothetical protein